MKFYRRLTFLFLIMYNYCLVDCDNDNRLKVGKEDPGDRNLRAGISYSTTEVLLDKLFIKLFPLTEGSFADTVESFSEFCRSYMATGASILSTTAKRWPFKLTQQAMLSTATMGWIRKFGDYCLNSDSQAQFVANATIVNKRKETLRDLDYEFRTQIIYITDFVTEPSDRQRNACCHWFSFKKKLFETAKGADFWLRDLWNGLFQFPETIYCQTIKESKAAEQCSRVKPVDEDPQRAVPKSWLTLVLELSAFFI